MSLVKWCPTQHALPRSAIFTEMIISLSGSLFEFLEGVFSSEIPDTSLSNKSLFRQLVSRTSRGPKANSVSHTWSSLFVFVFHLR